MTLFIMKFFFSFLVVLEFELPASISLLIEVKKKLSPQDPYRTTLTLFHKADCHDYKIYLQILKAFLFSQISPPFGCEVDSVFTSND
jgi:hypothetical protein